VFIHMHKTGGQTLNDVIRRCIPNHRAVGYHFPYTEVAAEFAALPRVGMVRNPWDWYVSWYAFNQRPNLRNPLYAVVSERGQADFRLTVSNLVNLGSDTSTSARHREELAELLPETLADNRGVGLTKTCIREFSENDTGYYSWLFGRMLGVDGDGVVHIGRFENLQGDFLAIMQELGVDQTTAIEQDFDQHERKNSSRRSHYSHYYDDELKDLVGRKEGKFAATYGYQFESIGPTDIKVKSVVGAADGQEFQKLLGRAKNYLLLHGQFDVAAINDKVSGIPEAVWLESERERRFDVHRDTQALLCIHFEDYKFKEPEVRELYSELRDELKPLLDYIADFYHDNGFVVRLMFAKLLASGKIPRHADGGFSLMNSHRIHIPLVSDEKSIFLVNGEPKNMLVGELWEINNKLIHSVENHSEKDRIHLIVDWMPNHAGRPVPDVIVPETTDDAASERSQTDTLNMMVAEAYQTQRAATVGMPELRRAESLYRQVLDIDAKHVVANNLLGLLCLRTKRVNEAVRLIQAALAEEPNDAQAHSNLGLAFKDIGRFESAANHFQQSLMQAPGKPGTLNNLGNVYRALGRVNDAITSYREVLVIDPGNNEASRNLEMALQETGTKVGKKQ